MVLSAPVAARQLRALLAAPGCVALPGAYNGLVGRAVADAGFNAAYVSGAAISAAAGVPDVGILPRRAFARAVRDVVESSGLPVLVDADTGFGPPPEGDRAGAYLSAASDTVVEYAAAGAAGLHLEDQVFPKRCGHLGGKELVPPATFETLIADCVAARNALPGAHEGAGMVICARTDARGTHEGLQGTVDRALRYAAAGADMIFPEGLHTEAEFAEVAEAVRHGADAAGRPAPWLLANMTEYGKTEMIPRDRFAALGYNAVIYPVTTLRAASAAVKAALTAIRDEGGAARLVEAGVLQTRAELYNLLEYSPAAESAWTHPTPTRKATNVPRAPPPPRYAPAQVPIRAALMRGGSSKGVFFNAGTLPAAIRAPGPARDAALAAVVGSPDLYGTQMDGTGSGTSSTSKVVIIERSKRPDCDVDYTFGHVVIGPGPAGEARVDWGGNCGNLSAAVGTFAVEEGMVDLAERGPVAGSGVPSSVAIRVWQTNQEIAMVCHVPLVPGAGWAARDAVEVAGDCVVPGVRGAGAAVRVEFLKPAPSLLPTGQAVDLLCVGGTDVEASIIKAGNPVVFVRAEDVGMRGTEEALPGDTQPATLLERIRAEAAILIGAVPSDTPWRNVATLSPGIPKVAVVAPPATYVTPAGDVVDAASVDVVTRILSMGLFHHAYPGTAAVALAAAAVMPGTLVHDIVHAGAAVGGGMRSVAVRFGHRSGCMRVEAVSAADEGDGGSQRVEIDSVAMLRTARTLMRGNVYIPRHLLSERCSDRT